MKDIVQNNRPVIFKSLKFIQKKVRLENPRDGRAWWAAICGVTGSRTWLKRLSSSSREVSWIEMVQKSIQYFIYIYIYWMKVFDFIVLYSISKVSHKWFKNNLIVTFFPPLSLYCLSPLATTSSFFEFVSFLFYSLVCCIFQILHISVITQYLSFSVWLISLSTMSSISTHVATNSKMASFLWLGNITLYVCISIGL